MRFLSILWIVAGLSALTLALDAIIGRLLARTRSAPASPRLVPFALLMLVLAVGSLILGAYESTV